MATLSLGLCHCELCFFELERGIIEDLGDSNFTFYFKLFREFQKEILPTFRFISEKRENPRARERRTNWEHTCVPLGSTMGFP